MDKQTDRHALLQTFQSGGFKHIKVFSFIQVNDI